MEEMHPHCKHLLACIDLEEKEEVFRYRLDKEHSLKQLKAEGIALHPIRVTRKNFGYADYPEFSFSIRFPPGQHSFKDGIAIELFILSEEPIKGILLSLNGKSGEVRLLAPDFPDWLEEDGVGIKLSPDQRTTTIMKNGIKAIPQHEHVQRLFDCLYSQKPFFNEVINQEQTWIDASLNESQQRAVKAITTIAPLTIIHGPPGTGKTTTLIAGIQALVKDGRQVLVSAPSNAAIDHICMGLLQKNIQIVRVGNTSKVHENIFPHTPEGHLTDGKIKKEVKDLKIRAEEFRKMALKYKRSFGKAEREQRNLLFAEVKKIRAEIKKIMAYHEERLFEKAQVVLGTPVGLLDARLTQKTFDVLLLDEAGQCLEPLAWAIFPLSKSIVLAGDHLQLPPTILSDLAKRKGFNKSILEQAIDKVPNVYLLDVQYRMREMIAGFSSQYFYESKLQSHHLLKNEGIHLTFIDTAGTGFEEEIGPDGNSLMNEGELDICLKLISTERLQETKIGFISPYAAQVNKAKENFPIQVRCSTIDSFQGQEMDTIILSLVRSNEEGQIGFLQDYRRMNVALTRAKNQLYVIGDSATIGQHEFYKNFLEYVEKIGTYRSAYEWLD